MFSRRKVLAAAATAPWAAPGLARAEATPAKIVPPTLDELLREPTVLDTALSPSGEQIAVLHRREINGKRTAYLTLGRPGGEETPVVIGDYRVQQVEWANDERLLIWVLLEKTTGGVPTGIFYGGDFFPIPIRRVLAVGVDGKNPVVLFSNQTAVLKREFNLGRVVDPLVDDPRHVLMQIWDQNRDCFALHRVDVYTGEAVLLERGTSATDFWITQKGDPVLRFDSNRRGTVGTIYARAPGESDWKFVRKIRRNEWKRFDDFDVVGLTAEPGVLLVSNAADGEDVRAIRRFDLKTLEYGDVVARRPDRDLTAIFTDEHDGLVGSAYVDDRIGYEFADPELARHFRAINTFFANECNVRLFDVNAAHTRFIFRVTGPRERGAFYFYDAAQRQVENIGPQYPWLSEARLARMDALKVKTRDGTTITAYLSTPPGPAGPRPMVVMPHGGPELRDTYDFDLWAQALAAQGWLVLQPNFRGSGGYGKAFADAGRRRWGDRAQEDVEDCVAHVIAAGLADPKRLAVMGASYGGYAALMGAVRQPLLYRAVVSIAGPGDLLQSLTFTRREDGPDSPAYSYWVKTMGDPQTDMAMLQAASPRLRAAEIQAPVLLIHGREDDIVPPAASREMARALKTAGKAHEHVELKGVGHGDWDDVTTKTVLGKSIAFLARALT